MFHSGTFHTSRSLTDRQTVCAQDALQPAHLWKILGGMVVASAAMCVSLPGVWLGRALRQCALLIGGVALMAPLMQTLTQAVSRFGAAIQLT